MLSVAMGRSANHGPAYARSYLSHRTSELKNLSEVPRHLVDFLWTSCVAAGAGHTKLTKHIIQRLPEASQRYLQGIENFAPASWLIPMACVHLARTSAASTSWSGIIESSGFFFWQSTLSHRDPQSPLALRPLPAARLPNDFSKHSPHRENRRKPDGANLADVQNPGYPRRPQNALRIPIFATWSGKSRSQKERKSPWLRRKP